MVSFAASGSLAVSLTPLLVFAAYTLLRRRLRFRESSLTVCLLLVLSVVSGAVVGRLVALPEHVTAVDSGTDSCLERETAAMQAELAASGELRTQVDAQRAEIASLVERVETGDEAWAMVLEYDDEERHSLHAAMAHVACVRALSHVRRPIVILYNEQRERLLGDGSEREFFRSHGVELVPFAPIRYDKARLPVVKLVNLLHLFRLPYRKVVYLSLDMAILRNLEFTFDRPASPPAFTVSEDEPFHFATSLMVVEPSNATFEALMSTLAKHEPTWDTSVAALLDAHFHSMYSLLPHTACPSIRVVFLQSDGRGHETIRDAACIRWTKGTKAWHDQKRHDLNALAFYWYDYMRTYVPHYKVPKGDYFAAKL